MPNARANELVDWLEEQGYELENEWGAHMYFAFAYDGNTLYTIDLTFTMLNKVSKEQDVFYSWAINYDGVCG